MVAGSCGFPQAAEGVQSLVAGPRVALLAVHESLTRFARGVTPDQHPAYDRLLAFAQSLGSVEVARCYGEWADSRRAAFTAGLEPTLSPVLRTAADRVRKRVTAAHMVVDGLDLLWQEALEVLVLATDDAEIAPLVLAAKRRGVQVGVVTGPDTPSLVREVAVARVAYRELIGPPLGTDYDGPAHRASFAGDPKTGQPLQTEGCRPEPGPSGCSDTDTATVASVEPRRAEQRRRRRRSAPARKSVRTPYSLS